MTGKYHQAFLFLAFSDLIDFQKASTLQTKPNTYCDYLDWEKTKLMIRKTFLGISVNIVCPLTFWDWDEFTSILCWKHPIHP